jgi:phage recombination protein Bet
MEAACMNNQNNQNQLMKVNYKTQDGKDITLSASDCLKMCTGGGNASASEIFSFMNICRYHGINPYLKEAYLIKYGTSPATIVTGKEFFMKKALTNPRFKGFKAGVVLVKSAAQNVYELIYREGSIVLKDETLVGGWAEIHIEGYNFPIRSEVALSEYIQTKKSGEINSMWSKMPGMMIRKCALTTGLREGLPHEFAGLYDEAEITHEETKPVTGIVIDGKDGKSKTNIKPFTKPVKTEEVKTEEEIITKDQGRELWNISQGDIELIKTSIKKFGYTSSKDVKTEDFENIKSDLLEQKLMHEQEVAAGSDDEVEYIEEVRHGEHEDKSNNNQAIVPEAVNTEEAKELEAAAV